MTTVHTSSVVKDAKRMFRHQGSGKGAKNRRDILSQNIQFSLLLITGLGGNDLALVQVLGHFLPTSPTKYDVTVTTKALYCASI